MNSVTPTRQQLSQAIDELPIEALPELANFIAYLQFKLSLMPSGERGDRPIAIDATFIDATFSESTKKSDRKSRGQKMADSLEKLAQINACSEIGDPVVWQQEIRQDRPLIGRNE